MTELTKEKLNKFLSDKKITDYRIGRVSNTDIDTNNDFILLDNGLT